ncbi:uncharacterized protein ACBR49_005528 isoform 1-T1 [Aulostomus maculatus]
MKSVTWLGLVLSVVSAVEKVTRTHPDQTITIECGVNTFSTNLRWHRENDLLIDIFAGRSFPSKGKSDVARRSKVKSKTSLQISTVKSADAGQFTCEVDGNHLHHTLLVVSVSSSPPGHLLVGSEATLQCQVTGLKSGSTVKWRRPDGIDVSHTVQLKPVTVSHAGMWVCTFSHAGETYSENLNVSVKELSPTSSPSLESTSGDSVSPSGSTLLLGLSWWVWIIVGVGCLVIVVLTVLVIVLFKRGRKREKRFPRMKNAGQPLNPRKYCQCSRPTAAVKPQQGRRREKPSALPL